MSVSDLCGLATDLPWVDEGEIPGMGGKSKEDRDKEEKSARFVDVGPKPPVNVNVNVLVNETRILGAAKMRLREEILRA